jgi:SSS family solute:Na+ symporter
MGLLIAAMLAADMSTDSSYMLTWGSVIYNDILAPFRRKPWPERTGILINRFIIAVIGLFLLVYGLWYPLKGSLWSYLTQTGTIYLASMSVILIACCYWPRANSWGAAASIIVSAAIPVTYLVLEQKASTNVWATKTVGPSLFGIAAYVSSAVAMVVGSLLRNMIQPPSTEKEYNA